MTSSDTSDLVSNSEYHHPRYDLHAKYDFINFRCGSPSFDPTPPRPPPYEWPRCQNSPQLIEACAAGNLSSLEEMLFVTNEKGDVSVIDPDPKTSLEMISKAIEQKQSGILALLLQTYPQWDIRYMGNIGMAFSNQDLSMVKLIHSHYPGIVNEEFTRYSNALMEALLEFGERLDLVLWETCHIYATCQAYRAEADFQQACVGGDALIPNFLIDHGADVNEGGFPGRGPLYAAVTHHQPLELVKKMVQGGAWISGSTLDAAIHQRQHHALEFLIDRYQYGSQESFLPDARKTNDQIVIEIVEKREKRLKPKDKTYRGNIFEAKG